MIDQTATAKNHMLMLERYSEHLFVY